MIIKENITLFICEYGNCKKKLIRKNAMEKHELNCSHNPKNHSACSGCAFLKEGETEVYYERNDSDGYRGWGVKQKTFTCEKLNKELYPFKVVKKGLLEKYPETFDGMEQMPNVCEHWNYTK